MSDAPEPIDPLGEDPFRPGRVIAAVFPRMMGKTRPGVIVRPIRSGSRVLAIVALPATTHRTNQDGRILLCPDPALGIERRCWLLAPRAAALPAEAVAERRGGVSGAMLEEIEAAMTEWFGADWPETDPAVSGLGDNALRRARPLHPRRRRPQ